MKPMRRSLRDELAFLLDSTVGLEPSDYDRDTLLMSLEVACEMEHKERSRALAGQVLELRSMLGEAQANPAVKARKIP